MVFITVLPRAALTLVFCHHVAEGPEPSGRTAHSREASPWEGAGSGTCAGGLGRTPELRRTQAPAASVSF